MDIGLQEIVFISVIALIVLGPERLPQAIKTIAIWINRIKRSFNDVKKDLEAEINADEIRRHIHNDNVLHELGESAEQLKDTERELNDALQAVKGSSNPLSNHPPKTNNS